MERQRLPIEEVFIMKTSDQNSDTSFARWLVGYEIAFALKVWYDKPFYRVGIFLSEADDRTNKWSEPRLIRELLSVHQAEKETFIRKYSDDGEFLTFSHTPLDQVKEGFKLWIGTIELEWSLGKNNDVWITSLYVKDHRFPNVPKSEIFRQYFHSEEAPDWDLCASA